MKTKSLLECFQDIWHYPAIITRAPISSSSCQVEGMESHSCSLKNYKMSRPALSFLLFLPQTLSIQMDLPKVLSLIWQLVSTPLTSAEELTPSVERFLQMQRLKRRNITITLKEGKTVLERGPRQKGSHPSFIHSPVTDMALNQQ